MRREEREAGAGAVRPIILNWNKSRSGELASQRVNVGAAPRRGGRSLGRHSLHIFWLLFGWTENNEMCVSCNNLILFLSVVCVLSRAGGGGVYLES